ncbi:hypothetical protein GF312_03635 [Candidatus Poribacteria bacterium]|nr:hypothetical protein [Candidatus Poribacteria bacterium]
MKIVKIVLIILLILVLAFLVTWGVMHYLVWPRHEVINFVPGQPTVYIAATGLEDTIWQVQNSEFVQRVDRSSIWENAKDTGFGKQLMEQKILFDNYWKSQVSDDPLKLEDVIKLVGKDALLAVYKKDYGDEFLLVSAVGLLERFNITTGSTKKDLMEYYDFKPGEYRGLDLMTIPVGRLNFTYAFIDRIGLLSSSQSLLKEAIDLHIDRKKGLTENPDFKNLAKEMTDSRISMYMNDPNISQLAPSMDYARSWLSWANQTPEGLRVNIRMEAGNVLKNMIVDDAEATDIKAISTPDKSLLSAKIGILKPHPVFDVINLVVGSGTESIKDRLNPVMENGVGFAVLSPDFQQFQIFPPVLIYLKLKGGFENTLEDIRRNTYIRGKKLEFAEVTHEDNRYYYTRIPVVMGMSIDVGYTVVEDNILVMSIDRASLKKAIELSKGMDTPLEESIYYKETFEPVALSSDAGSAFVDIASLAAMTEQGARLFAWQARISGDESSAHLATMIQENVFILEAWEYLGATFGYEDNILDIKIILSK